MSNIKKEARLRFLGILNDVTIVSQEHNNSIRECAWTHYIQQYDCCEELFDYREDWQDVKYQQGIDNKLPTELYWFLVGSGLIDPDQGDCIFK